MVSSPSGGGISITLTSYELYLALIVIGVLAGVLGFVTHTVPSWIGYAGIGSVATVFFGMLADEFVPTSAVEYIVVTVVASVVGVLGYLTGVQNIDLVAVLTWVVAILGAIYASVSEQGGQFLGTQQETIAIGLTGAALSFFTWWLNNPTATTAALITTIVVTIGQFLRVSVKASAAAARVGAVAH